MPAYLCIDGTPWNRLLKRTFIVYIKTSEPIITRDYRMRVLLMFLAVFSAFPRFCAAQHVTDFDLKHFNTESGLPQNSIKAVARDEYGFIWLASEAGLLRYDGRSFKIYSKKNTRTSTSRLLNIASPPGRKDLLAIADTRKMLRIEKGRAKAYQYSFNTIFLQHSEHSHNSADSTLGLVAFRKYNYVGNQLLFLENGYIAAVSLQGGISWYKNSIKISHTPLNSLKDFSSVFVLDNAVFLSHEQLSTGRLKRFEPGKVRYVRLTGDFMKQTQNSRPGETFFVMNHATKDIFLFSGSNLYLINLFPDGNLNTKLLLSGFGLLEHQICTAFYDSTKGRLFLGSGTEGLFIFTRKRFHSSLYPDKDPFTNVQYSLVPLTDSSLLCGSGLVFFTQKKARPQFRELLRRPKNYGYELLRSEKRGIWFSYGAYVYQFDYTAHEILGKFRLGAASAMSEHNNNDVWIATLDSGIYRIDTNGSLSRVLKTPGIILCMVWETDNICWIGTENHLFRFSLQSGKLDTFPTLNDKLIRSIYIPRPNEVWICCYENGMYLWKDGKLTSFSTNEYPALQTVHKILEDDKGFFWISTNDGLYQALRTDLLHHHKDSTFQPYFFRYSTDDGFLTNEFNGSRQHSGTKLANGFFAFPSMKGVVFFKPKSVFPELPDKEILIDRILVDGKEIDPEKYPVSIERGFKQIIITPTTAYFGNDANLQYEFKLNNNNAGWQALTGGSVVFSALSSGPNLVIIRKRSGFGRNGYVYCSLPIYVSPAWWDHTWFYVASVIILALVFGFVIRLRTRYWRQRSQSFEQAVQNRTLELNSMVLELERSEEKLSDQLHFQRMLNENITHDVNAPLKYLTIYTNEVLEQVKGNKLPDISEVEHIHDATNRIYALVDNLTKFLKTRYKRPSLSSINVHNLVQQKLEVFRIGAKKKSNQLENNTAPDLFVNQNEILLGILLHNLIDNAVKCTVNGRIFIQTHCGDDGLLSLLVHDTGQGMPAEQVLKYNHFFRSNNFNKSERPLGFGLIFVKEIAKILAMKVSIESILGKGTIVTVTISAYHSNHSKTI